jgi:hypothetical protein
MHQGSFTIRLSYVTRHKDHTVHGHKACDCCLRSASFRISPVTESSRHRRDTKQISVSKVNVQDHAEKTFFSSALMFLQFIFLSLWRVCL